MTWKWLEVKGEGNEMGRRNDKGEQSKTKALRAAQSKAEEVGAQRGEGRGGPVGLCPVKKLDVVFPADSHCQN